MQELYEEVDKAVAAGYMDQPLPQNCDPNTQCKVGDGSSGWMSS